MGATFAFSSVLTPFFMGTVVGAIAAGNVPADGNGDAFSSWIGAAAAAHRRALRRSAAPTWPRSSSSPIPTALDDEEMESYFSRRALVAGILAGAVALPAWSPCTPKLATSTTASSSRACRW